MFTQSKNLFFILLILLSSFFSKAQNSTNTLLEGTVGKDSIRMKLESNGVEIWGQYYFKESRKSIPLEAKYLNDKTIQLEYEHLGTIETFF